MAPIHTTAGPVEPDLLVRILVHEHLLSSSENVRFQWPHLYDPAREVARAIEQVEAAKRHGVRTIVDPACMDLARDVHLNRSVTEATGVPFVMATGVYGSRYTFLPPYFANREPEALVEVFVHDLTVGIQGTEFRAAFLKCACDEPGMTEDVEKVHRAVARASLQTGAPIMAHSHPASQTGLKQLDVFEEEGVDLGKVQLAHTGDTDDLDYIEAVLARGVGFIGMDRFGLDIFLPQDRRVATVAALAERGYADRMTLSQDACATIDWFPEELIAQMAPNWHFTYLFEQVLEQLREAGVTDEQIATMLDENPLRWLTS
jgi:phosphotriesterase-related protein